MTRPERSHRKWLYFAVPAASIIFAISGVELGLSLFHPIRFSVEANTYFEADALTGYRLKPNSIGYFQQHIPARINENGHRDEFVSLEKPEGVFRVLALGDSFTIGVNVAQDEAYPEVLEALLAENNEIPIEVVNTGVGGWDPFQYAQYYEHYGWRFSPDLILVGFFVGNDTYQILSNIEQLPTAILGRRISKYAVQEDRFIHLKVFLYNHSNIARLLLNKKSVLHDVTRKNCSDFSDMFLQVQRDKMDHHHLIRKKDLEKRAKNGIHQIQRIKRLADRDSIPLRVVLIPDENQINEALQAALLSDEDRVKHDFGMPQSMLVEMFSDAGIPTIDLLTYFREDGRCLYMNDTHWTAEGHALAAAVIHEDITDEDGRIKR